MRKKRQLDDPRAIGDPAKGAVIFAFGLAAAERQAIPGPALVAILGALGFSEPTARASILRMRREGRLASHRRGPVVEYELAAASRALADDVLAPVMGERPTWDGSFQALLFSIPERARSYRDALRRAAVLAGFGSLQPGVLVTPDGRRWARLEPVLQAAPAASRLLRADLRLDANEARDAAAAAWSLGTLARRYREQAAAMEAVARDCNADPPEPADAVRILWEAMTPLFGTAIEDPNPPAALLPIDWPREQMRQAVIDVSMALMPSTTEYLHGLWSNRSRSDHRPRPEPERRRPPTSSPGSG